MDSIRSELANGVRLTNRWNALNQLSSVTDERLPEGYGTTYYQYDQAGNLAKYTYPNLMQTSYEYDERNRLKTMKVYRESTLAQYAYTLGPTGNRTAVAAAHIAMHQAVDEKSVCLRERLWVGTLLTGQPFL